MLLAEVIGVFSAFWVKTRVVSGATSGTVRGWVFETLTVEHVEDVRFSISWEVNILVVSVEAFTDSKLGWEGNLDLFVLISFLVSFISSL